MSMLSRMLSPVLMVGLLFGSGVVQARGDAPAAKATPPVPLLWKVTGPGDSRVYLLGSFHLLRAQDYPLAADVDQAFAASKRVVFELSPQDMQSPQLTQKMLQAAVRTDGTELKRDLDPATWTKLQAYATANNLPLAQLQGMKPWFVGLTITLGQFTKMGLDPNLGLDRHFMQRARRPASRPPGWRTSTPRSACCRGCRQPSSSRWWPRRWTRPTRPMWKGASCMTRGAAVTTSCCGPRWPRRCAVSTRSCTSASTPSAMTPGCPSCSSTCRPGRAAR